MRKINILTKSVYNRIAAGEVVERPYSAVKELIENSLDAKATEIEIYIECGGKQLIKVVDNGTGIERDDMRAAFFPHATSKIVTADDLNFISTLGFRGEALASISSVSRACLTSVTVGNGAYKVDCEGGKIGEVVPAALSCGTEVCIRDLFYNTPARLKFLKADKKEEADVTNFVTRYILGNPDVAFKFYSDGKLVLQSYGGGFDEAVAQVYGAKVISQCFKIDAQKDGVRLHGYIGNQNFFKFNKSYQSIFLNGRYIVNNTIATAISQAYAAYTMKRQYPFYVLFIDVPTDIVDVNVHPSKADVRFVDNKFIFGIIYSVVSSILDGTAKAADFVVDSVRMPEMKSTLGDTPNSVYSESVSATPSSSVKKDDCDPTMQQLIEKYKPEPVHGVKTVEFKESAPLAEKQTEEKSKDRSYFDPTRDMPLIEFLGGGSNGVMSVTDKTAVPNLSKNYIYEDDEKRFGMRQERIDYASCKYCGNLFNTYLLYEILDKVYIIDQHAAHERLIFDRLCDKISRRESIPRQPLLIPYVLETNPEETLFLENNLPILHSMGFSLEPFGSSAFRVDEVPVDLQEINIKDFFGEILADLNSLKDIKLQDIMKDKLAMAACKHAVKGGMQLTDAEVDSLFKMLEGDMGLKCPHGRPICVTMYKRDFEKMFKRIV